MEKKVIAKVVRFDNDDKKLIISYDDKLHRIALLAFQNEENIPEELQCTLTETDEDNYVLALDYEKYIREKYNENDETDFKIVSTRSSYYDLVDLKYGLRAIILKQRSINPAVSTVIHCRITNIKGKKISLTLAGDASEQRFSLSSFYNLLYSRMENPDVEMDELCELITNETSADAFNDECRQWILDITSNKTDEERQNILNTVRRTCFRVIEGRGFLTRCQLSERTILEQRLTIVIEQTGYYLVSYDYLANGRATKTIEDVLRVLKNSGYHYHPRKWFSIMLNIFLQDFDLMRQFMPKVIEALCAHSLEVWKRQPIDSLWIELLEVFISKANLQLYRATSDNELAELLIKALILQLSLNQGKEYSQIDDELNHAILLRLIARQNVNDPAHLLKLAFSQLFGVGVELPSLPRIDFDTEVLANMISNHLVDNPSAIESSLQYSSETAVIKVEDGSIVASRVDGSSEGKPLLKGLGLQYNLDVIVDDKVPKELKSYQGLDFQKRLWKFVDQYFFSKAPKKEKQLRMPMEEEDVHIIVTEKIDSLHFRCKIVDEDIQGYGILDVSSKDHFTPYVYYLNLEDFYQDGRPLIFDAEAKSIDEDGTIHFSLAEYLSGYFEDYKDDNIDYDTPLYCMLNSKVENIGRVPAVSREGLPISVGVENPEDLDLLCKGLVVEVRGCENTGGDFFNATFVSVRNDMFFRVQDAIHNMLVDFARGVYQKEVKSDDFEQMEYSQVNELMRQLEMFARFEADSSKAYCYLAFCHLMAKMMGDDSSMQFYNRRMTFLEILYDFEKNNKIREENLAMLSEDMSMFSDNVILRRDFMKMNIISWLERDGYEEQLFNVTKDDSDPELQQLAQLVQAFNFVHKANMRVQAEAIRDHIRSLLKLKASTTNKKFYGLEDDLMEFKTSIVYQPGEKKPNIAAQTNKIMQEICAFLNARGGKLYLGVNDAGYECGLEEDMKHDDFKGNREKYKLYVENQIANILGQEACHYSKAYWDDTVTSDVLVVELQPCPNPVSVAGQYYERMGTSARRVNEDYEPMFLKSRRKWAEDAFPELFTEDAAPAVSASPVVAAFAEVEKEQVSAKTSAIADYKKIKTSSVRNNALHDYDDGFVSVEGYIYIADHAKYKISDNEWEDAEHPLTLAVHNDELDGYLILTYANGNIAKVELSELMDRQHDSLLPRYAGSDLIFASIAKDSDSLIIGLTEDNVKRAQFIRVDDIPNIPVCSIQHAGFKLTDLGTSGAFFCDLAPTYMMEEIGVRRNEKRTTLGSSATNVFAKTILSKLGIDSL